MADITMQRGNLLVTVDETEREALERNGWAEVPKPKRARKPKEEADEA